METKEIECKTNELIKKELKTPSFQDPFNFYQFQRKCNSSANECCYEQQQSNGFKKHLRKFSMFHNFRFRNSNFEIPVLLRTEERHWI